MACRVLLRACAAVAICVGCTSATEPTQSPGGPPPAAEPSFTALIFSRTAGFRHDSIPAGIAAVQRQGATRGFAVQATEDPSAFSDENLSRFKAVVFLSTTGDVLDAAQEAAFERFIRRGGGFVGVHAAADTEYDWPFYGGLIGAYFGGHPDVQSASIRIEEAQHPTMTSLPSIWTRRDEWYNFQRNPRGRVTVLATLDERTYAGGTMGADHPIIWAHQYEGGRAWYTAGGHTAESFAETPFADHIGRAVLWAAGAL